jgi:hypothetical protein
MCSPTGEEGEGGGKGGREEGGAWRNGRPVDRPRIRRSALACQLCASQIWRLELETKTKGGGRDKQGATLDDKELYVYEGGRVGGGGGTGRRGRLGSGGRVWRGSRVIGGRQDSNPPVTRIHPLSLKTELWAQDMSI